MKKLMTLLVILSVGMFTVGCGGDAADKKAGGDKKAGAAGGGDKKADAGADGEKKDVADKGDKDK